MRVQSPRNLLSRALVISAGLACLAGLTSCGGGAGGAGSGSGGTAAAGRLALTVIWPDRSRLVPSAANSIRAVLTAGTTTRAARRGSTDGPPILGSQLITRPALGNQNSVTFNNLAPGPVTLTATALPYADGSGVAVGSGFATTTIVAGQAASVTVNMASTIDHLEISPAAPSVPVGQTLQLTATAKNAAGDVVLMGEGNLRWVSLSPAIATVDAASGVVTGVSAGTTGRVSGGNIARITATEIESGKTAAVDVSVTAGTSTAGLAAFWKLDEGSGNVANDASGNGNTGKLATTDEVAIPSWIPGKSGSALRFTGFGYVEVPNSSSLEPPQQVSVEAWVRHQGSGAGYVLSKGATACSNASYALYDLGDSGLSFYVDVGGGAQLSPAVGPGMWDGNWHHIAGTYDGKAIRIYLDGAQVGNGTATSGNLVYGLDTNNKFYIGGYRGSCDFLVTADIDEVKVWGRALTAAEIAADAGGGSSQ